MKKDAVSPPLSSTWKKRPVCFAIVIVGLTNTFACWMRWKRNVARPVSLNRLETKLGALTSDEFRALGKQLAALLKLDL